MQYLEIGHVYCKKRDREDKGLGHIVTFRDEEDMEYEMTQVYFIDNFLVYVMQLVADRGIPTCFCERWSKNKLSMCGPHMVVSVSG